jgi:5-methylcytosine-specific restriction enzyme A
MDRVPSYRPKHLPSKAERDKAYDEQRRDKQAKAFYNSTPWQLLRLLKLAQSPYCECQICQKAQLYSPATIVHHVKPIKEAPELRLDIENLRSYAQACHSRLHAAEKK